MIFDNTSDTSSYQATLEEMRKNLDINWFLWKLKAQNEEDVRDFTQFASLASKSGTGSVSLSAIAEWGITPAHSRIIRNLVREKLAEMSDKEIRLIFPVIDRNNAEEFLVRIADTYHRIIHADRPDLNSFPSGYFYIIEKEICKTVPIQDLGWQSFDSESYKNKLIEIVFTRFHLPHFSPRATTELAATTKKARGEPAQSRCRFSSFSLRVISLAPAKHSRAILRTKLGNNPAYIAIP